MNAPKQSEKTEQLVQAKILKVAEVCGVELPNAHQSMNYTSGTFGSCGIDWCREQYNTNKVLLDAVSQVVVGMTHCERSRKTVTSRTGRVWGLVQHANVGDEDWEGSDEQLQKQLLGR